MAKFEHKTVPVTFGRYQVIELLGQGAMATVYKALDPNLNRIVAIKVIHTHLHDNANLVTRFTSEAKTAAALRNQHIVEIFDYGVEGQQYLVMEYIDGPTLQEVLQQYGKPLPAIICAAFVSQAADGLATAEKFGVVHRDIKPENLMITRSGFLKVADFGIAHISEQNLTQTGSVLGSPNFMSPEQIDGRKPTPQTDMFSLGAVFYNILTGTRPFSGPNIPMIMRRICDEPHVSVLSVLPEADPELAALADTLLQKKPEDRGQGARWVQNELRAWLGRRDIFDAHEVAKDFLAEVLPPVIIEASLAASVSEPTKPTITGKPKTLSPRLLGKKKANSGILIGALIGLLAVGIAFFWPNKKTIAVGNPEVKVHIPKTTPIITPTENRDTVKSVPSANPPTTAMTEANTPSVPAPLKENPASHVKPVAPNTVKSVSTQSNTNVTINVLSAPPFAEVEVDGKVYGATPLRGLSLPAGRHSIKVVHRDYLPKDTIVNLSGSEKNIRFRLF